MCLPGVTIEDKQPEFVGKKYSLVVELSDAPSLGSSAIFGIGKVSHNRPLCHAVDGMT